MAKTKIIGHPWELVVLWNQAINCLPERPLIKRDYVWASELGGAFVDRYLRMNAVPMTNPPNERSRRKFLSGHIFEWIVSIVLVMVGILQKKQVRTELQLRGLPKVTGKMDYIAGGDVDWERAYAEIERMKNLFNEVHDDAPPIIMHATEYIYSAMRKQYERKPLKRIIYENKAVSTFAFQKMQRSGAMAPHILQTGHYIIANADDIDEGKIGYICKDDCLMEEFSLEYSPQLLKLYKKDLMQIGGYMDAAGKNPLKNLPPREPEVLFDDKLYRFERNLRVEYSSYLEMLYGYKTPEEYRDKWQRNVTNWNRVFKRVVRGDKITDKNKPILNDVTNVFPDWEKYVYKAKSEGAFLKPEESEE